MHKVYEVHTWTCSIPDCKEQLTGYGEDHAGENGWDHQILFDEELDLCPFHVKEIREFLFG